MTTHEPSTPDLREVVLDCNLQRGALSTLHVALAALMGRRAREDWEDALPPPGLRTAVDDLVPWMLRRPLVGTDFPGPRVDLPHPIALVHQWVDACGATARAALERSTVGEAASMARRWHEAATRHLHPRCPVPEAHVLLRFDDDATIVRLVTPRQLDEEGLSMDHCLRGPMHYWYDTLCGDCALLSYRDPAGVPQVTVELGLRELPHEVVQLQGPANGDVADLDCRRRMAWFLFTWLAVPVDTVDRHWLRRLDLAPADSASGLPMAENRRGYDAAEEDAALEAALALDMELRRTRRGSASMEDLAAGTEVVLDSLEVFGVRFTRTRSQPGESAAFDVVAPDVDFVLVLDGENGWYRRPAPRSAESIHFSESPVDALLYAGMELNRGADASLLDLDDLGPVGRRAHIVAPAQDAVDSELPRILASISRARE